MAAKKQVPVVGIGASAGGVEALGKLFRNVPADTGMAFAVVMHLAHDHQSLLSEILVRDTDMPVVWASHKAAIKANHIYLCPAGSMLTVRNGRLALQPRPPESQATQIDVLFSSLAEARGEAAVGVLLSGSGHDGTVGMKAIKERGGLTIAQGSNGSSPMHGEMPNAAIAAGAIDLVLPVEAMAARIAAHARGTDDGLPGNEIADEAAQDYRAIHEILHKQLGNDFSGYKQRTFQRRVMRRMEVNQLTSVGSYLARLREDAGEVVKLFRDLLIGVTGFFRDPEAFDALAREAIPRLFENKSANEVVRVWVPACSTGEEVYSIAILLHEHRETLAAPPAIQVFATDIDESALGIARLGRYPASLLDEVTPQRLKCFFASDGATHFAVAKEVRDICVFSTHSLIRDPPFSRLDLISCRNLLIYLGAELQSRVFPVFHFALKPGGYLFLGTSENIGVHGELFAPLDKKQRVFVRRDHVPAPLPLAVFGPARGAVDHSIADVRRDLTAMAAHLRRAVEARMTERFAPAHVVVNRDGDILHYSARTGKYLEPAAGTPSRQLISMARKGLRPDLRAALREAIETRSTVERRSIEIEIDERSQLIDLVIDPMVDLKDEPLFLVLFRDVGLPAVSSRAPMRGDDDAQADRLEHELREMRARLQTSIEEYETGVEELKSSNEELQSVNEELQSTNEELEASKEELQSLNEELHTVNAELTVKIEELDRANMDLRNIFESTGIAIVFLDKNLVIRSFTPAATAIFNLIPNDRGRPLSDIASNLDFGDLPGESRAVFASGKTIERNVSRRDGSAQYLMRILPYRTQENQVQGILVAFVDITVIVKPGG